MAGRPKSIIPNRQINVWMPEDLMAKVDLTLMSEVKLAIPYGAYREFFCGLVRQYFEWRKVPLEEYGFPQGFFITGPKEMVEAVCTRLAEKNPSPILPDQNLPPVETIIMCEHGVPHRYSCNICDHDDN